LALFIEVGRASAKRPHASSRRSLQVARRYFLVFSTSENSLVRDITGQFLLTIVGGTLRLGVYAACK
jgi:hypothetical protein